MLNLFTLLYNNPLKPAFAIKPFTVSRLFLDFFTKITNRILMKANRLPLPFARQFPRSLTLLLACISLLQTGYAQSIELQVVGSAGSVYANSAGSLHFTVGEPMIRTNTNSAGVLPEGFHQQMVWLIVPADERPTEAAHLHVYPNPVSTLLHIDTDRPVDAALFDLTGRAVLPAVHLDVSDDLPVADLPPGFCFLRLSDTYGRSLRSFKIQHI